MPTPITADPWWQDWRTWKDILTPVFALYAAIVSTFLALRDRGRLRVTARYARDVKRHRDDLMLSIVNSGRRPMTVKAWRAVVNDRKPSDLRVETIGLPKELKEAEEVELRAEGLSRVHILPENMKKLYVIDTFGKKRYVSWSNIRRLRKGALA